MTRTHKGLIILAVACVGLWGCSQGDQRGASHDKRMRSLEAKCCDLETECAALKTARDEVEKKLADMTKDRAVMQKEIDLGKLTRKERDDLKVLLAARTGERDSYQVQLDELRKGIRSLLSRVDSALPPSDDHKTAAGPKL